MNDGQDLVVRWRRMAEECRVMGEQMTDPGARSSFEYMARTYDGMADRFERRTPPDWLEGAIQPEPGPPGDLLLKSAAGHGRS